MHLMNLESTGYYNILLSVISNGLIINYGKCSTTSFVFAVSYTEIPRLFVRPFSTQNTESSAVSLAFWYNFNISITGSTCYVNSVVPQIDWFVIGY